MLQGQKLLKNGLTLAKKKKKKSVSGFYPKIMSPVCNKGTQSQKCKLNRYASLCHGNGGHFGAQPLFSFCTKMAAIAVAKLLLMQMIYKIVIVIPPQITSLQVMNILKYLFPVPKDDSKRVITFSNKDDHISFRYLSCMPIY